MLSSNGRKFSSKLEQVRKPSLWLKARPAVGCDRVGEVCSPSATAGRLRRGSSVEDRKGEGVVAKPRPERERYLHGSRVKLGLCKLGLCGGGTQAMERSVLKRGTRGLSKVRCG